MRLVATALLLLSITALALTSSTKKYDDPEAYAVYRAMLVNGSLVAPPDAKLVVVQQESEPHELCSGWDKEPLLTSAIEDYKANAKTTWLLQPMLKLSIPSVVSRRAEITESFYGYDEEMTVSPFDRRYPDSRGYVVLSAVGFNTDKTLAIVSKSVVWRPPRTKNTTSTSGGFYVLEKKQGWWTKAKWLTTNCGWGVTSGIVH